MIVSTDMPSDTNEPDRKNKINAKTMPGGEPTVASENLKKAIIELKKAVTELADDVISTAKTLDKRLKK